MHFQNCWEFKHCGRERAGSTDACPACNAAAADGVNGGVNAGRVCWAVTGTLCDGKRQGTYAEKVMRCMSCDFRLKVREEMTYRFMPIFFEKRCSVEASSPEPSAKSQSSRMMSD